mmetsp:Transcript_8320/g.17006  ORF Transcript_8320/g.17006 Transcript_8320/m.17006 type:complete len:214 (+) Transcript_8320:935-1576(+)
MAAALPLSTSQKLRGGIGGNKSRPSSVARSSPLTTACRVSSSSVKRRPSRSKIKPPTPRNNSAASVFVRSSGLFGSTKPVGCNCTRSKSTSRAPMSRAILTPSPVVCGPSVVGKPSRSGRLARSKLSGSVTSCPKPPDVMTTLVASNTLSEPLTTAVALQPAPPRSNAVHFVFRRSLNCWGLSAASFMSNWPAEKVISAPTKAFLGRRVRVTV